MNTIAAMIPRRIQRQRTKGWRMPPNTVYVGRPTVWGNPFRIGIDDTAAGCVLLYRRGIEAGNAAWGGGAQSIFSPENSALYDAWEARAPHLRYVEIGLDLEKLRGKNLACWCAIEQACHADVLLEFANAESAT